LPIGFTYAYIGATGQSNPAVAIVLSAGLPPLIWIIVRWYLKSKVGAETI
jgi:hypothetical protein